MALSVMKDRFGPDWPLGLITVAASGTPVNIMSVVDASNANAPQTATPTSSGGVGGNEYSVLCQQIIFQACKSVGPVVDNTGAIYVLRAPAGSGTGNKTDSGVIVAILQPGQTYTLGGPPRARQEFSPYRYWIDSDTSADGCLVTLII
jgi:hypothetical protein